MDVSRFIKPLIGVVALAGAAYWLYDGGWDDLTRKGLRGTSVYTATRSPKLEEELFVSAGSKSESQADAEALANCEAGIKGVPGLTCHKVTFLSEYTCMTRYRVGNGHYTAEKSTLKSAQTTAKFNCEKSASGRDPAVQCIKDAEICGDGSVARLRPWGRAALGLTKPYVSKNSKGSFQNLNVLGGNQPSEAAGRKFMEDACLKNSGKSCLVKKTFSGDTCYALAASTSGDFAFFRWQTEVGAKLKALAKCGAQTKSKCQVVWLCASPLKWNN